jgi:hypothetical protein
VGSFGLGNRTFDDDVINLAIIISVLALGLKISIGSFGDCQDCAVGVESVGLLRRFLDLWQR